MVTVVSSLSMREPRQESDETSRVQVPRVVQGAALEHFLRNGRCCPGNPDDPDAMCRTSSHATFSCKFLTYSKLLYMVWETPQDDNRGRAFSETLCLL